MTGPGTWTQPPTQAPEAVRDAAREVLEHPRYRPPEPSLAERAVDWVVRQLRDAFDLPVPQGDPPTPGGVPDIVAWLALLAAGALLAVLLVRVLRTVRWGRRGRRRTEEEDEVDALGDDVGRPADAWRADALAHAAAGRWREAVRAWYRVQIALLAAADVVEERVGTTGGEYAAVVALARPDLADAVGEATLGFQIAWYSGREVDAAAADRQQALTAAVEERLRTRPARVLARSDTA